MRLSKLILTLTLGAGTLQLSATDFRTLEERATLKFLDQSLAAIQWRKGELPNGMQVLLITDPGVDKSAIAVSVGTGSMENPKDMAGLAHFLEHMLTRGSAAYPEEGGYRTFINENGGWSNAFTSMEQTNYHCEINHDALEEALDRMAHHFIDPLFYPDCVQRELNAVHQEYRMKVDDDSRKGWRLSQHLMNQENPMAKFSTGNLETLAEADAPAVAQFWANHYSAHQMNLVVVSNRSLEELEELIAPFEQIERKSGTHREPLPLYDEATKGLLVYQKPLADTRRLELIWELPQEVLTDREAKIEKIICYLLNDETEVSLAYHLKQQGWITSCSARANNHHPHGTLLTLSLGLTEEGLNDKEVLVEAVFAGISALQTGIDSERIASEINGLERIRYGFQSRKGAFARAKTHAMKLAYAPLAHYPDNLRLIGSQNPQLLQKALGSLTPKECIQWLVCPEDPLPEQEWQYEPIRKVDYKTVAITKERLDQLTQLEPLEGIAPADPNPWICTDFTTKHPLAPQAIREPKVLHKDDDHEVLFIPDDLFGSPKGYVRIYLNAESVELDDAKTAAALDCAVYGHNDVLLPTTYQAKCAGIHAKLSTTPEGLCYTFSGFSEKIYDLIQEIGRQANTLTEEQFERHRQKVKEGYTRQLRDYAFKQASRALEHHTYEKSVSTEQKLAAIDELSFEDYVNTQFAMADGSFTRYVIGGNITEEQAEQICESVAHGEASEGLEHRLHGIKKAPSKPTVRRFTIKQKGCAPALQLYCGTADFSAEGYQKRAAHRIMGRMLHDEFFQDLRSNQGACYVAYVADHERENSLLLRLITQSTKLSSTELLARYELFLEKQVRAATSDPSMEETFTSIKQSLIEELRQPYQTMEQVIDEITSLHVNRNKEYHFKEKLAQALEELTFEQFQEQLIASIDRRQNPARLALILEGAPSKDLLTPYSEE